MNKENNESFVYKWTCHKTRKTYIGKHKGTPDDGYVSSSADFNLAYRRYPGRYTREILQYGSDRDMLSLEGRLISRQVKEHGYLYTYNDKPNELKHIIESINTLMDEQQNNSTKERGNKLRELRKQKYLFIKRYYGLDHF